MSRAERLQGLGEHTSNILVTYPNINDGGGGARRQPSTSSQVLGPGVVLASSVLGKLLMLLCAMI